MTIRVRSGQSSQMSKMKYLHTMIRVNDMLESIHFYTEVLGMTLLEKTDYPDGRFTLAFLSYGTSKKDPCIELTHNWDRGSNSNSNSNSYSMGDAFGHLAFGTADIYGTCDRIRGMGAKIVREPGPMKHGTTVIAFVEDPNGYKIELIEG